MSAHASFTNPLRRRYYGLRLGDRVRSTAYGRDGEVVELAIMDNNRVYVLWDGNTEPSPAVAEWCDRIDKDGNIIKNRYTREFDELPIGNDLFDSDTLLSQSTEETQKKIVEGLKKLKNQ